MPRIIYLFAVHRKPTSKITMLSANTIVLLQRVTIRGQQERDAKQTFEDVGVEQSRVQLERAITVLDDVLVELEVRAAEGPVATSEFDGVRWAEAAKQIGERGRKWAHVHVPEVVDGGGG
jgi:hypothetical protein